MNIKRTKLLHKSHNYNYGLTYPRIVALGFLLVILAGTALLMLPISIKNGDSVTFTDALFTAVSATCVTGLVIADTFSQWTLFGQIVILCMIQVGGLGFITILAAAHNVLKRRSGLREKMLLKETFSSMYMKGVTGLGKKVVLGTAVCELAGALILCTRFIPMMGFKNGLYTSVFLSVSAYCNAGFDVLGRLSPGGSLTTVNSDPVILLTLAALITIGGLGFIVLNDLTVQKFKWKRLSLHSKIVLTTSAALIIGGAVLFFIFENNNTLNGMNAIDKITNSIFSSVTPRTAGFNSVDVPAMSIQAKLLTIALMFIGGSSGSTAGGIKTTTFAVILLSVVSTLKNDREITVFKRRIDDAAVRKAVAIVAINFTLITAVTFIIHTTQPELHFADIYFECTSAMGTVGMTCALTPSLETASKLLVALLMYLGRVTNLVFALMFVFNKPQPTSTKPYEKVIIG